MANSVIMESQAEGPRALRVTRLLTAGAVTAAVIFVVCWAGTFIPFSSPTHAYISLFTTAEVSSGTALVEGSFWSLLFGGLTGALFAVIYNSVPFGRR